MEALGIAGDNFGSMCHYRSTLECGMTNTTCSETGAFEGGSMVMSPCFCDHCTDLPLIYESFGPMMAQMASGNADTNSLMSSMCQWTSTIECLATNAACADVRSNPETEGMTNLLSLKDTCVQSNMPLRFGTSYSYQSPTCGSELSGAVKLLQPTLLAASSFLLAILN